MTKNELLIKTAKGEVPLLGVCAWWNVRNVEIQQDKLVKILEECGLPTKYAKEHNFRSAFIRALHNMEEKRIIRKVSESDESLVYQFTAELKVDGVDSAELEYKRETVIVIDKNKYRESLSFETAIVKCDDEIKKAVVKYFYEEKVTFNSSDITRILQKILGENADIVMLREQGNVYFVPARFMDTLEKAQKFMAAVSCSLEYLPIPDASQARATVGQAFEVEVDAFIQAMEKDLTELKTKQDLKMEVTDKWLQGRVDRIGQARKRMEIYATMLEDGKVDAFEAKFKAAERRLVGIRNLDI